MAHGHGRIEDARLLTGGGRFVDDIAPEGALFGVFLRSPHAHARIARLDVTAARAMPGVHAVLTAEDIRRFGAGSVSRPAPLRGRGGTVLAVPPRPALAEERVLHVGQPVALVVADSIAAARDAAEAVAVDYAPLPAVVDARAALEPGAPQLWPEAPGNLALDWPGPQPDAEGANAEEVARLLAGAAHVVRLQLSHQRITAASLEPRGATAWRDGNGGLVIRCGSQGAGMLRDGLAAICGIEPARLRVLSGDVGGAFGMKTPPYPEYVALLAAAALLGRPVRWMATRGESFESDNQARDGWSDAELGLDADGRFVALRVRAVVNLGAFNSTNGAMTATNNFARCLGGMYRIPRIDVGFRLAFTNTLPTGPYRGAGRPEANMLTERLVEAAARQTGRDPVALRRINLLRPEDLPHRTATGALIDSGDFPAVLEAALRAADAGGFAARRAEAAAAGRLRGFGLSCFLEHSGALPFETAELLFDPVERRCTLRLAVQGSGQGHPTVFARLAAERLGIAPEQVSVEQGDSAFELRGMAAVGSRSSATVGTAVVRTAEAALARARGVAATLLQSAPERLAFEGGVFADPSGARIGLFEVAAEAARLGTRLDARETTEAPETYPNGCHVAEVELDPETGHAAVRRYVAVDDAGVVLDHVLADGQVMGGAMQGIGQALMERVVYDAESGQLLTGGFTDYAMPRADDAPEFVCAALGVPARTNPLGVKGVGEAGTTAALAAVVGAIEAALPAGARVEMPATPEALWRALRDAAGRHGDGA
ncbi:MAG: xanthine dehydrogenase family protein molybdopterin-binding subunit [Acetobacteraceae bacterium]